MPNKQTLQHKEIPQALKQNFLQNTRVENEKFLATIEAIIYP